MGSVEAAVRGSQRVGLPKLTRKTGELWRTLSMAAC